MREKASLAAYTAAHFCVDFTCFYVLYAVFAADGRTGLSIAAGFLTYNCIAFGLQTVIGAYCDAHPACRISLLGCALLAVGLAASPLPWAALALSALGNACFHVGGGIDSLVRANGRLACGGVFVASGALGVPLGTLAGRAALSPLLPAALLLAGAFLLWRCAPPVTCSEARFHVSPLRLGFGAALTLCLVSVVIRAYGGAVVPMPWRADAGAALFLLPGLAACVGKASGGFLADRFGARRVGVLALAASAPLLTLCSASPLLCAAGLLLFNMTMPVSLGALASRLPHAPGLAFGLSTLALLLGATPTFYFGLPAAATPAVLAVLIVVSGACLWSSTSNE